MRSASGEGGLFVEADEVEEMAAEDAEMPEVLESLSFTPEIEVSDDN